MKIVKQLIILFLIYMAADLLTTYLSLPLPATLISMILLIVLLLVGAVKEKWIDEGSRVLLKILPVLFIPAGVRILDHVSLLSENFISLTVIVLVTTFLTFAVTLLTVNALTRRENIHGNDRE